MTELFDRHGRERARLLEADVAQIVPGLPVRAIPDTEGPKAAGPDNLVDLIQILVGTEPIDRIASYLAIAQGARILLSWLRRRGTGEIEVGDGVAILLAADAIHDATGDRAVTLLSVDPVRQVAGSWEGPRSGFLVRFEVLWEDAALRYGVHVLPDGTIAWWRLVD
jgi:hypothetical protein